MRVIMVMLAIAVSGIIVMRPASGDVGRLVGPDEAATIFGATDVEACSSRTVLEVEMCQIPCDPNTPNAKGGSLKADKANKDGKSKAVRLVSRPCGCGTALSVWIDCSM